MSARRRSSRRGGAARHDSWAVTAELWRPRPAVRASIYLHAVAAVLLAARPGLWRAVVGGLLLDHSLLTVFGLWPSSSLLGHTVRRLPEPCAGRVALTFDDGPDPDVTPRVLDLLDRHGARATFFCIGSRAAKHPGLLREIRRRGHTVGNHTMHHPHHFAACGFGAQRREVAAAQAVLGADALPPRLFRAPVGLRNPLLDPVLHGLGLAHVSWSRRGYDTRCGDPATVLARLSHHLRAGDILLLHDGNCARTPAGLPVVLPVLEALLALLASRGLRCVNLDEIVRLPAPGGASRAAAGVAGSPASAGHASW